MSSTKRLSSTSPSSVPPAKKKYVPTSGTYPKGFSITGHYVGIKPSNKSRPDLTLLVSDRPCSAAAVFTQNVFKAAPVLVSKEILEKGGNSGIRGVIVNAGCANAVTGEGGLQDARTMIRAFDDQIGSKEPGNAQSLVMSTGVIGQRLPIDKIVGQVPAAFESLGQSHEHWIAGASAIMTTDTFPKLLTTSFALPSTGRHQYNLAGMTKGAGMIHPNMATLLGIMATDCAIPPEAITPLLKGAIKDSFNSISIDGDTSTNDSVYLLANGASQSSPMNRPDFSTADTPDSKSFQSTLTEFATSLAKLVVRDGEGATKFLTLRVHSAPSDEVAHAVASSIARSPLVKTAMYGRDANWGRILCAIGYTPNLPEGSIVPNRTSVSLYSTADGVDGGEGVLHLLKDGEPEIVDESRAARILTNEDLTIDVNLGGLEGSDNVGSATFFTTDFSLEYIVINSDYRT